MLGFVKWLFGKGYANAFTSNGDTIALLFTFANRRKLGDFYAHNHYLYVPN